MQKKTKTLLLWIAGIAGATYVLTKSKLAKAATTTTSTTTTTTATTPSIPAETYLPYIANQGYAFEAGKKYRLEGATVMTASHEQSDVVIEALIKNIGINAHVQEEFRWQNAKAATNDLFSITFVADRPFVMQNSENYLLTGAALLSF